MKQFLTATLAFCVALSTFAQTKTDVEALLIEYEAAMKNREWTKSLDYVYPALFDVVPRDYMAEVIETTFNSPELYIGFDDVALVSVSEVYNEEGLAYSFAQYTLTMNMTLTGEEVTEEQINSFAENMMAQFGPENVKQKDATVTINTFNKMAVLKKEGEEKFYMLEIKEELREVMGMFMSTTFIDRAFTE